MNEKKNAFAIADDALDAVAGGMSLATNADLPQSAQNAAQSQVNAAQSMQNTALGMHNAAQAQVNAAQAQDNAAQGVTCLF